jgi:predicted flavoprotein YhiN
MASIQAARRGFDVTLTDKNDRPGKKLLITGKGRCNITNDCDIDTFLANVPRNGRFLYGALSRFPPREAMRFFREEGVALTVERGRRVFPESGKARDIVDALCRAASAAGVSYVKANVRSLPALPVILATGGASYPHTGSDGGGYALASAAGHTVTPPEASIVPLLSRDIFIEGAAGLTLKNVAIDGEVGEMLITHTGLSGPLILGASARWRKGDDIVIDLKPGLSREQLDARLVRDFALRGPQLLSNALRGVLPAPLIPPILAKAEVAPGIKACETDKQARRRIVDVMKAARVAITDKAPLSEAIVTRGGVRADEIKPATMESKKQDGLHFAGEIIDVDAYTGGYNLHIALCTGYAAGMGVGA